jgi:lipid A ethanolaminephosphotransferase
VAFAFGVSFLWLLLYNAHFWRLTFDAMWQLNPRTLLFTVSLFVLGLSLQALPLLVCPTRRLMRVLASLMFVVAALGGYFGEVYGAIMNQDMMRNVLQTDATEALSLLNADVAIHVILLGILPAALVWRIRLPRIHWRKQLAQRGIAFIASVTIAMFGMIANSAQYATFLREHKPVRYTLNPTAQIVSMAALLAASDAAPNQPLIDAAGAIEHTSAVASKPLVLFLVIGETARAANFQLGGYQRSTNPELAQIPSLVYFSNVSACATSTALSVPCLFSHFGRSDFKVAEAKRYANLLDSLVKAGFEVQWRDNNSGCKGVCARVATIDYTRTHASSLCSASGCYDEILLADLPETLRKIHRDTVIVFHQKGSHGPSYFERYPPSQERFRPACRSNQLQHCSQQEIANAYDNSIAYTDHVLARQISLLQAADAHIDSLLLYVSDHGESLGENGLYLHGMPYPFAPAVQKQVPMLLWASDGYLNRTGLRPECLRDAARQPVSHDFFYHTVLGAAEILNQVYDPKLDLIAGCRQGSGSE